MVMPLPSHLRLPSPTNKPTACNTSSHPRSPIKKHLQARSNAASSVKMGSPQRLKSTVAQNAATPGGAVTSPAVRHASTPASTVTSKSHLRAATLQALLGLLDRDDEAMEKLLPMLHALAALPLEADGVLDRCLQALKQIRMRVATPDKQVPLVTMSHSQAASRESGRAKSSVSLKHCKEFLLACANEIHELEEVNPCFDYAEETGSEMAALLARQETSIFKRVTQPKERPSTVRRLVFDYASTVDSNSTTHSPLDTLEDDMGADTGSQLSELLLRTVEAEKEGHGTSLSLVDRVKCRRALHAWRGVVRTPSWTLRGGEMASLYRAFTALQRHRAASQLSLGRKKRVFGRMKALLTACSDQQMATPRPPRSLSLRTRVAAMLLLHWDLVLLLAIAFAMQFGLQ